MRQIGNLDAWVTLLKALNHARKLTRAEIAEKAGLKTAKAYRVMAEQILPLGIMVQDGWGRDNFGNRTYTFSMSRKGQALIDAILKIEQMHGTIERREYTLVSVAVRPERTHAMEPKTFKP